MGDDVKITVIATGFRQESPGRRDRMLASYHVVPVTQLPVATAVPAAAPRFASEEEEALPERDDFFTEPMYAPTIERVGVAEPEGGDSEQESDELDIPAFMRRNGN